MVGERRPGERIRVVGVEVLPEMVKAEPRISGLREYSKPPEDFVSTMLHN